MKKYYKETCKCGCGSKIEVKNYHKYYGIPDYISGHNWIGNKHSEETKLKMSISGGHRDYPTGKDHPNWVECDNKYCGLWINKEFRQFIKDRDGNKCLNPTCNSKNPNDLTGHHIDYNKMNCDPSNIITICRGCNTTANMNRDWHQSWYEAIINRRYK